MGVEYRFDGYARALLEHVTRERFGLDSYNEHAIDEDILRWIHPTATDISLPVAVQCLVGKPFRPTDKKSILLPIIDPQINRLYMAKQVTPFAGLHYQTREKRQEAQRTAFEVGRRNNRGFPGLYNTLRYVLPQTPEQEASSDLMLNLSEEIKEGEPFNPNFEIALLMEETGPTVGQLARSGEITYARDVVPLALADLHQHRARKLEGAEAKIYTSFDAFRDKFFYNDNVFALAIEVLRDNNLYSESIQKIWLQEYQELHDSLRHRVFEDKTQREEFTRIFNMLIELGFAVDSHGDTKFDNFSVVHSGPEYGAPILKKIAFLDAVDFNDFRKQICIAELASFERDMSLQVMQGYEKYIQQMRAKYLAAMSTLPKDNSIMLAYQLFCWDKDQVSAGVKIVRQNKYEEGLKFFPKVIESMTLLYGMLNHP